MKPSSKTARLINKPPKPPDLNDSDQFHTPVHRLSEPPPVTQSSPAEIRAKQRASIRDSIDANESDNYTFKSESNPSNPKSEKNMKIKKRKQKMKKGVIIQGFANHVHTAKKRKPPLSPPPHVVLSTQFHHGTTDQITAFKGEDMNDFAADSGVSRKTSLVCLKNKKMDSLDTPIELDPLPSIQHIECYKSAVATVNKIFDKNGSSQITLPFSVKGVNNSVVEDGGNKPDLYKDGIETVMGEHIENSTVQNIDEHDDILSNTDKIFVDCEMDNNKFDLTGNNVLNVVKKVSVEKEMENNKSKFDEVVIVEIENTMGQELNDTVMDEKLDEKLKDGEGNDSGLVGRGLKNYVGRVSVGGNIQKQNVWNTQRVSFAELIRKSNEDSEVKMDFVPPMKLPNGQKRVIFSEEEVKRGGSHFNLQLYGYFIGTSMDYQVVNSNLRRMWRSFELKEITKTAAGFYLCKFKSEKGMKAALEAGPWLVENVPFFINQWEPGVWLEKIEPQKVPLWVCIHNIPIELWNGKSIGKLVSGIGRPVLMDKVTMDRCINKNGRLGYARVLVEIEAEEELPKFVEFEYPAIGAFPAKVGRLEVSFQWKPPVCTHCKVFGHSFKQCKKRPITEDEKAAQVLKDALKVRDQKDVFELQDGCDEDGFRMVGKKKKIVERLNREWRNSIINLNRGDYQYEHQGIKGENSQKNQSRGVLYQKGSVFDRIRSGTQAKWVPTKSVNVNNQVQKEKIVELGKVINERSTPVDTSHLKVKMKNKTKVGESRSDTAGNSCEKVSIRSRETEKQIVPTEKVYVGSLDSIRNGRSSVVEVNEMTTSNAFSALANDNEEEMGDSDSDDDWDTEYGMYNYQIKTVDAHLEARINPSQGTKMGWNKNQVMYFNTRCKDVGLNKLMDDDDVASETNGTAQFMKLDNEDDEMRAQEQKTTGQDEQGGSK